MKFAKNKKFIVGLTSGLATTAAIVTPLVTSCGNYNDKLPVWIKETDAQLGIDEIQYNRMKETAVQSYQNWLDRNVPDEAVRQQKMNTLNARIEHIDQYSPARATNGKVLGYTALTTMLMNLPKTNKEYSNIDLTRSSTFDLNDLDNIFGGYYSAMKSYMLAEELHPTDWQAILDRAEAKYEDLKEKEIVPKYGTNIAGAYIDNCAEIFTIFEEVSDEVSILDSLTRLKQFLSKYSFEYIEEDPDGTGKEYTYNRIDNLWDKGLIQVGQPIKEAVWNKSFVCIDNETQQPVVLDGENPGAFVGTKVIPGYTVTPVLNSEPKQNKFSNTYQLEIDWQLIKNTNAEKYANDAKARNQLTAHIITSNDELESGRYDPSKSLVQYFSESHKGYDNQGCFATYSGEQKNMQAAYNFNHQFNNDSIGVTLKWNAEVATPSCENFYDKIADGETKGTIDMLSLAKTGLTIASDGLAPEPLLDVINRMKDNDKPDEELTQAEKFVKYCDLYGDVEIKYEPTGVSDTNPRVIDVTLYSAYKNSCGLNQTEEVRRSCWTKIDDYTLTGVNPSLEFFDSVNTDYNETATFFDAYRENDFIAVEEMQAAHILEFIALTCVSGTLLAWFLASVIWEVVPSRKISCAFAAGITTIDIGAVAAEWALFDKLAHTPILDYIDETKELHHTDCFKAIDERLAEDEKNHIFVRADENGYINKESEEYQDAYTNFSNLPFISSNPQEVSARKLQSYYGNFKIQKETQEFMKFVSDHKISPKEFKKTYSEWLPCGKWTLICMGIDVNTSIISYALVKLHEEAQYQKWLDDEKKAEQLRHNAFIDAGVEVLDA